MSRIVSISSKYNHLCLGFGCQALLLLIAGLNYSWNDRPKLWISLTVLIFLVYGLACFYIEGKDFNASHLESLAETAYFMGYLTTIFALVLVAFQVNANPDIIKNIPLLLFQGGYAITSTVAGLIVMFVIRLVMHAKNPNDGGEAGGGDSRHTLDEMSLLSEQASEILNSLKLKSMEVFSAFDQISSQIKTTQGEAVVELFAKVQGLAGSVNSLGTSVSQVSEDLQKLQKSSERANGSLSSMAGHSAAIKDSMVQLSELSSGLILVWQKVQTHLDAAGDITLKSKNLSEAMSCLHAGFGACEADLGQFVQASRASNQQLLASLEAVRQRANQVGSLVETMEQFTAAAQKIAQAAPALNVMQANLREVLPLAGAMQQLLGNVQTLNGALNDTARTTGTISQNSQKMMISTGMLVEEIDTQMHKLINKTEPLVQAITDQVQKVHQSAEALSEFTDTMKKLQPYLDNLGKSGVAIESFCTNMAGLKDKFGELEGTVDDAASHMKNINGAVDSFVFTVDRMLSDAGSAQSSKSWPHGRRPS